MRKIKVYVNTGFVNAKHEETFEVEDDTTDEELDEMVEDFLNNCIEYGYYEVDENDHED